MHLCNLDQMFQFFRTLLQIKFLLTRFFICLLYTSIEYRKEYLTNSDELVSEKAIISSVDLNDSLHAVEQWICLLYTSRCV